MSETLDLRVPGDPAACRAAATTVRDAATTLSTARSDLSTSSSSSEGFWTGPAGEGFRSRLDDVRSELEKTRAALSGAAGSLDTFAGELEAAKAKMDTAREVAVSGGLQVSGDTITAPTEPGDGADDAAVDAHNSKVEAWNTAVGHVDDGHKKETEAHSGLEDGMKAAIDVSWVEKALAKVGIIPEHGSDPIKTTGWGLGLAGTAGGVVAAWKINSRYGTFSPRGAGGRWVSPSSLNRWQWGARSMKGSNWKAKPFQAATRGTWMTGAKWLGRAGGVVTFATSAYGQWQKDADDPTLSNAERVGRSATVGGTAAAGAWGGATLGAAIGTAIFPGAGTVVGGLVGGAIGGIAGSAAGEAIADFGGDVADKAWEGIKDVGDVASDIGDKLKFW